MKKFFKCLGDMCCNCMAHFQRELRKFKECMQLPPCDCETECKKETNDSTSLELGLLGLLSFFFLWVAVDLLNDVLQDDLDYQIYVANMMQTFIMSSVVLFFYFAKQKDRKLSLVYLGMIIIMMIVLWYYHSKIRSTAIEKKQPTAICSCCWEKPVEHRGHSHLAP